MDAPGEPDVVDIAAGDVCRARRGADGEGRRCAVSRRRSDVSVHRHPRRRGGDPGQRRQRARSPWEVGVPRRVESALGADGLRHGSGHTAVALYRCRPRSIAIAAVRGRPPERPPALDLHRAARGVADGAGRRSRDRRPPLVGSDHADARVRQRQPPSVHLGGHVAARWRTAAARALAGRRRAARADHRRGLAGTRDRPGAGAPRGGRPGRRRRGAGRSRCRGLRRLRGPRHAHRREHRTRRSGRLVAAHRELPRLPRRDLGVGADEPCSHPGAEVRGAHGVARTARCRSNRERIDTSCIWRTIT